MTPDDLRALLATLERAVRDNVYAQRSRAVAIRADGDECVSMAREAVIAAVMAALPKPPPLRPRATPDDYARSADKAYFWDLAISPTTYNALVRSGFTAAELIEHIDDDDYLRRIRNVGRKRVDEIRWAVKHGPPPPALDSLP